MSPLSYKLPETVYNGVTKSFLLFIDQYSCPEPGPGSGPGSSTFSREGAITVAVVVTALVVMLIATVAIVVIVLRLKRGTKQGISNPAYGK